MPNTTSITLHPPIGYSAVGRTEDGTMGYDVVNASHHYAPHALLVGSEACSCPGVELGNWMRAERVGHDVMYDLLNHAHVSTQQYRTKYKAYIAKYTAHI
jgi:hypothetical protein